MRKEIIIVGQGEQGLIVKNVLDQLDEYSFKGFLDDGIADEHTLGKISEFKKYIDKVSFFIALGDNVFRKKIFEEITSAGGDCISIVHPTAVLEPGVKIGVNVYIGAFSYLNIGVSVADNTIVNTGCVIEHDNIVKAHTHIAPSVTTAGRVTVGEGCLVGMGSVIIGGLTVGDWAIVGAMSNVVTHLNSHAMYYGNPAKKIKDLPK